eukprot:1132333-Amphidinium_carterae.1
MPPVLGEDASLHRTCAVSLAFLCVTQPTPRLSQIVTINSDEITQGQQRLLAGLTPLYSRQGRPRPPLL